MPLEIKDLSTQKPVIVPEEGLTFGREGGDANVQLRDTGVSKRHARVFGENGAWFLEDLGSSNGTWLQKERIKDATELLPGDVFQLSQAKFEVIQVTGDESAAEPTVGQPSGAADDDEPMDEEPPPDDEPLEENEPTPPPQPAAKGKAAKQPEPSAAKGKPLKEPASKKLPAQEASKSGAGPEASKADGGKKKSGIGGLISGVGLLFLPSILGLTGEFTLRAIRGGHSGSSSSSTAAADAQVAAAEAQAEAAAKQAEAAGAAAEKQGEAAAAAAEKQVAAAEKAAEKGAEKAAAPPPAAAEPAKAAPPPPAAAAAPPPAAAKAPEAAAAAPPVATGGGYAPWHQKWEAIEKRITDDPTVLNKNPQILTLYKQLEEDIYEVEQKFAKGKKPAEKKVNDHLRDAELYEKTEKTVLELHQKLFK